MPVYSGYRIKSLICHGNNTTLYLAEREQDGTLVAIRTPAANNPLPDDINRLRNDYEVTRAISISGVARPLEFVSHAEVPFLVLEYSGSGTLVSEISATNNDLGTFLHYAIQTSRIVGEIHKQGIIHRDIKPQNILIDRFSGSVSITDFGIAARIGDKTLLHSGLLEGSLPYMSPEQTGRMNLAIDIRSDLYSLGISFYEMLVGRPPFTLLDPMEMVHAHIAKTPISPADVNLNVPPIVSDIVMRLLAKNPDDRYQTAFGLALDLRECLDQWEENGSIEDFHLGSMDISGRFLIPKRLYGRDKELGRLTSAVERVSQGRSEILLISGTAGVGKSAFVNEMQKPIIKQRSYFISGKYDQNKLDVPYSALVQAFQDLTRQLLMENEDRIQLWRERLLQALGSGGQVLIDVIPDLELIIGKQPPVPVVDASEALTRFSTLFERFIGVFCRKGHPLVMFLDDLQWADSASLHLLKLMTSHGDESFKYFLVICAYRDNEVFPGHPAYSMLDVVGRSSLSLDQIYLNPLTQYDIAQLLAESLNHSPADVEPLAYLVHKKTGGNPFFARQFLWMLHNENYLSYDPSSAAWVWNLELVERLGVTDNIVDLMTTRIKRLPPASQECLRLASCIGNRFDLQTLSVISKQQKDTTLRLLNSCITEGLVLSESSMPPFNLNMADPSKMIDNPAFRFLHDRVQQAAYNLIPENEQATIHFRIGELLLDYIDPESLKDRIFEVVNHLNLAIELYTVKNAKTQLASLNLQACKKAKSSVAFALALRHIVISNELLDPDSWDTDYDLTLDIHMERMECELVNGMATEAERTFGVILKRAHTDLDKAKAYDMQVIALTNMGRYKEAIESAKIGLKLCGVFLANKPNKAHILWQILRNRVIRGRRKVRDLVNLPDMRDPKLLTAVRILGNLQVAAYYGDSATVVLSQLVTVNLSILHGNAPESSVAYAAMSLILCSTFNRFQEGHAYALLALDLCSRFPEIKYVCQVNYILGAFAFHWVEPIYKSFEYLNKAYESAMEAGTIVWFGNSATTTMRNYLMSGLPLNQIRSKASDFYDSVQKVKHPASGDFMKITTHYANLLQHGIQDDTGQIELEGSKLLHELEQKGPDQNLASMQLYQAIALYILGHSEAAHEYASLVRAQISRGVLYSSCSIPECNFIHTLTSASRYPEASAAAKKGLLRKIKRNQKQMKLWAASCPENYLSRYLIAEAENMRILGKPRQAELLYDQGIESARNNGFVQIQAIANELAGRFHLGQSHTQQAVTYLKNARDSYDRWNATAKANDLEKEFPFLAPSTHNAVTPGTGAHSSVDDLDFNSIMKAAQSLAEEMILDKLLDKLVHIIVENAGAQKGIVVLNHDGRLTVAAQRNVESDEVTLEPISLEDAHFLSRSIVNYAARKRAPLVINDAIIEERFIADPYISQNKPRSILCLPMIHHGDLIGIIYLENNLTTHAFTPDRVELLKLLSTQIAISIENSSLYMTLERSEAKYRSLIDNMLDYIIIIQDQKIVYINRTLESTMGYTSDEVLGHDFVEFLDPEQLNLVMDTHMRRLAGEDVVSDYEIDMLHKNGHIVNVLVSINIINYQGRPAIQGTMKDISDRKRAEEELKKHKDHLEDLVIERTKELADANDTLREEIEQRKKAEETIRHMAYHDVLTGLPNRKHFQERLDQELSRAERLKHCLGVMFIDLDWFKSVNDTYGHEVGDKLLCEVANRLKTAVRKVDIVSRLGGDEFTAVLVDLADPEKAFVVANRMFKVMSPPVRFDDLELDITCSIGISIYPIHGSDGEELLRRADAAMYEAKKIGKNNYQMYQLGVDDELTEQELDEAST
ncbi:MAG: diguanylate cyclase domain-containing protein [Acidobacteriota bacterium]